MIKPLRSGKRLVAVAAISAILVVSLVGFLQTRPVVEAAMVDPHPGLVGWWRFDEGTGTTTTDSSTYGNDGTIHGATWTTGKYGQALSFDGLDDYVEVPNSASLQISDAITIVAWVKKDSNVNFMGIIEKQNSYFLIGKYSAPYGFYARLKDTDEGNTYTHMSSSVSIDEWALIVVTWVKGDYLKIYYNGVEENTSPNILDKTLKINNNRIYIGYSPAGDAYFDGIIDEVRLYNRNLSENEVQESFQNGPDFSSKLLTKVPEGTTQVIVTVTWQGIGSINVIVESPSETYTEDVLPVYQKNVYSTSSGTTNMLNIKRLSITENALVSPESWYILLECDNVNDYKTTVEVQK